ncbi:MAG: alpha/beta fold hydrolase [Pseudomonadales bacterium]|nr:alpha/beta fold hydrolase [Pseudomonadales bacterium]
MSPLFPGSEQVLLLDGPTGQLESIVTPAKSDDIGVTAIICHPHPQMGGTMSNKVVHTIARALRDMGCRTVRFNFRGVGASEGEFDQSIGEVDDLMAVVDWVKEQCPDDALLLAGFSFGSYVAACGLSQCLDLDINVRKLLLIAPPVHHMGFDQLPAFRRPVLVVQGDDDEVVPAASVWEWVDRLELIEFEGDSAKPVLVKLPDCGHFFHGKLPDLKAVIVQNVIGAPTK